MNLGRGTIGCLIGGLLLFAGGGVACDDRSEVPADLVTQQPDPTAPEAQSAATTRPTTQELVEGKRVPITLDVLPLTLQVPQQWKITRRSATNGPLVWLGGPTPAGEVQIGLKFQEPLLPQKFDQLLQGTRREMERAADPNAQLTVRQLGPAQVIERRSVSVPFEAKAVDDVGMPITDPSGVELTRTVTPMRWRVSVYVPGDGRVDHYDLNFIDLEKPQYDADRAFLEDILKSLRYTGAGATPTTGPATAPR